MLGAVQPFAAAQQILGKSISMDQLTFMLFFFIVMSVSIAVLRSVFSRMLERVPQKGQANASDSCQDLIIASLDSSDIINLEHGEMFDDQIRDAVPPEKKINKTAWQLKSYMKSARKLVGLKAPVKAQVVVVDGDDEVDIGEYAQEELTAATTGDKQDGDDLII